MSKQLFIIFSIVFSTLLFAADESQTDGSTDNPEPTKEQSSGNE
jgi:hypothetical protein